MFTPDFDVLKEGSRRAVVSGFTVLQEFPNGRQPICFDHVLQAEQPNKAPLALRVTSEKG
ncbi:MAG: hypothetical protein ABIV50_14745 [Opitutus sp.]